MRDILSESSKASSENKKKDAYASFFYTSFASYIFMDINKEIRRITANAPTETVQKRAVLLKNLVIISLSFAELEVSIAGINPQIPPTSMR